MIYAIAYALIGGVMFGIFLAIDATYPKQEQMSKNDAPALLVACILLWPIIVAAGIGSKIHQSVVGK